VARCFRLGLSVSGPFDLLLILPTRAPTSRPAIFRVVKSPISRKSRSIFFRDGRDVGLAAPAVVVPAKGVTQEIKRLIRQVAIYLYPHGRWCPTTPCRKSKETRRERPEHVL